jgi:hypothetical protein
MRRIVRNAATLVSASMLILFAVSCDDDDITGVDDADYSATLNAANERPAGASTATGTGVFTFDDNGTSIDWTLTLTNVTGVTQSHIHGPATVDANASVIVNLFMPNVATGTLNGFVATGSITNANNANVSLDSLRTLFNNGNAYANVHTTAFPPGAIRGQITPTN